MKILNDRQLKITLNKIKKLEQYISDVTLSLKEQSLDSELIDLAISPNKTFKESMQEDCNEYESIKKGTIQNSNYDFRNIGLLLIDLRISRKVSQSELAKRLESSLAHVCKLEYNEYRGASITTINGVLKALNLNLRCLVIDPVEQPKTHIND